MLQLGYNLIKVVPGVSAGCITNDCSSCRASYSYKRRSRLVTVLFKQLDSSTLALEHGHLTSVCNQSVSASEVVADDDW